jgi:hypothetical protein
LCRAKSLLGFCQLRIAADDERIDHGLTSITRLAGNPILEPASVQGPPVHAGSAVGIGNPAKLAASAARQGRTSPNDKHLKWTADLRSCVPLQKLTPRAPQRGYQSLLLLIPAGFFGLRSLLKSLDLGLDGGGPLRVLLLG